MKTVAGIIGWSLFWTAAIAGAVLLVFEWHVAGGMYG
jgi:hypothetical protein